jgi:predicted enzyme related to lactoylglutathione lyase
MGAANPVVYFEIPVNDINRAKQFYSSVFGFKFTDEVIDSYEMALFPFAETGSGVTGALAKGDVYKPTNNGVIIYFKTDDIDTTLQLATEHGGKVLYPKTVNATYGLAVAEFEDSEGNRIALQQKGAK